MHRPVRLAALLGACLAVPVMAQAPPDGEEIPGTTGPTVDHDMSSMATSMSSMSMNSALGNYAMSREGSGTSWQPEATPMSGQHAHKDGWMVMAHGYLNAIYDEQSGPRGAERTFTQSMFMLMAQRSLRAGTLGLRAMLSLDPTQGPSGYPLLGQTGETADGKTALVDRQHPHDFFMEIAATYSVPLGTSASAFVYAGLPGEPALGPPAFMHRFSGMRNPEAPLSHHWFDSTHVTFGVLTLGASQGAWKVEASWFNSREPDQHRWDIETRELDSWSGRVSFNPDRHWALQVSFGDLKSPEQLEPEMRVARTTASASFHASMAGTEWQTTLGYAVNHQRANGDSRRLPAWLLESTAVIGSRHTLFGRFERLRNDELFASGTPLFGTAFTLSKWTVGYIYDFVDQGPIRLGVGALLGVYAMPGALDAYYGAQPHSQMLFLQARL